ncbi:hypothetical protein D9619_006181 [Psilocybe cf. subviscida]|uniref:F-box domain-containing protein n=1 Tax=Psilocybe cf. subviscida TaxID=2480587 RepID=A0A8H5B4C8_9AGAR|nr:hypothetical protein D9619_006181 [Psilocybe cf. subviscida]
MHRPMENPPASNSKLSVKQVLLDQQMAKSEQHLPDLKTQRNIHAPISQLSPETLLRIFNILKDDEYNPFNHHLSRPFLTKHIIVHVCRQWRTLAFSAPTLWNTPPLWDHDWALTYLKLSKSEPLDVKIFFTKAPLWTTVLKHMSRVKVLSIECYYDLLNEMQTFLRSNKSLDAPLLAKLDIHSREEMDSRPSSLKLLNDTFRRTDALRWLGLRNVTIEWDSPLLRHQLTTLELIETPLSARPTWKQLMDVLRGLPSLETLKLSQVCPLKDNVYVKGAVHLPNLHHLIIDCDTPAQIAPFLSQVTFPQLRKIGGGCFALQPGTKDYMEVLRPLLKLIPAGTKVGDAVTKLKLSDTQGRITSERLYITLESTASSDFPVLDLHLPCIKKYDQKSSISSIIRALGLCNLEFVGFYSSFGVLDECFGDHQNLVTIEIGYAEELPCLTKALEIPIDHPPNASVPFPNLKVIGLTEIHGLPWRDKNKKDNKDDEEDEDEFDEDWDCEPWELSPERTWTNFRNCLIRRSEYGVPVQELHVQKCTALSMGWFDSFQEVVPVVKWDKNGTL